jgi:dihydropteroate synthase
MFSRTIRLPRATLDPRSETLIMGVINATPDSFSDGGVHFDPEVAVQAGVEMFRAGAHIVDVGGESTRPGSLPIEPEEELRRTIPIIKEIHRRMPDGVISIDTRRGQVAEAAIEAGAQIVNDVSGFRDDPALAEVAREASAAVVVMHMLGLPKTMQQEIRYHAFPGDIYDFLADRVRFLQESGIDPGRIVIDPGIGFGKTFDQNLILVNRLEVFRDLGKPILLGPSRKSFLGAILDQPNARDRDTGTLAVITASILRGADIVRVHDVPSAVQACRVADAVLREKVKP